MLKQLQSLLENENYIITLLSNTTAFFNEILPDINWVGYYLYMDDKLILGPFQGKLACEVIPLNRGVCGRSASLKQTILVEDVHSFPGHIACDSASNSEIVIPIMVNGQLYGLLDIDSPTLKRFTAFDQEFLESCVDEIASKIEELVG